MEICLPVPERTAGMWVVIFGYIGARLVHVLDHWEVYAQQPLAILAVNQGGFGLLGALIGGTLATLYTMSHFC